MAPTYSDRQLLFLFGMLTTVPAAVGILLKKLLRISRQVTKVAAGSFYIDPLSHFGSTLLRDGEYEPHMAQTLRRFLQRSATFVDVGANEGYFTVLASRIVGPTGTLVAVEPQRRLGPVLIRNFELNEAQNVVLEHYAISDQHAERSLHISPDINTGSSSFVRPTRYALPTESVETITLGELFARNGIDEADLVKMDIEGFEYEAILGSRELFEQHRVKAIALELHPWILTKRHLDGGDITGFLEQCGYRVDERAATLVYVAPPSETPRTK